uniref:PX domain-containing protein n=1 Tax=Romanomermis culicivorax TaxID=13658 RepID=A0A915L088_ROMCU
MKHFDHDQIDIAFLAWENPVAQVKSYQSCFLVANESLSKISLSREDGVIRKLSEEIDRLKLDLNSLKEDHERFIHMYELKLKTLKIQCESFKESKNLNIINREAESVQSHSTDNQELLVYEQKLIQLSQMHGELLELNDHLMKQDRLKSKLNERLRLELIALRGPLPEDMMRDYPLSSSSDANSSDIRPLVNIWIPTSFLTGKGTDVYTIYQNFFDKLLVYLRIADSEWNVYRRYSEFLHLHNYLIKKDPHVKTDFKFPPKKKFGSKKKNFVDTRRRDLEQYLRKVINYSVQNFPEFSALSLNKETLSHLLPFFKP